MKRRRIILFSGMLLILLFNLSCAEITPPTPYQVLKQPLGTGPLYKGMSKQEIIELWGQPNEINKLEQQRWTEPKEEWVYKARVPAIPVDYNYLSRTKYLYFEGDTLVDWKTEGEEK